MGTGLAAHRDSMPPLLHGPLRPEDDLRTEVESEFRREHVGGYGYGLHGESHEEDGTSVAQSRIITFVVMRLCDLCDYRERWLGSSQFKLHIPECPSFFYPDLAVYPTPNVQEWYDVPPSSCWR